MTKYSNEQLIKINNRLISLMSKPSCGSCVHYDINADYHCEEYGYMCAMGYPEDGGGANCYFTPHNEYFKKFMTDYFGAFPDIPDKPLGYIDIRNVHNIENLTYPLIDGQWRKDVITIKIEEHDNYSYSDRIRMFKHIADNLGFDYESDGIDKFIECDAPAVIKYYRGWNCMCVYKYGNDEIMENDNLMIPSDDCWKEMYLKYL